MVKVTHDVRRTSNLFTKPFLRKLATVFAYEVTEVQFMAPPLFRHVRGTVFSRQSTAWNYMFERSALIQKIFFTEEENL
jgi:hypothetical protein